MISPNASSQHNPATNDRALPEVAVVILNWNGKPFLEKFLPSVMASTYANMRLIVADNASTDDSVAFLAQYFPSVECIINASNQGFAKGYNSALKKVHSDYYVLLNSDVEVTPGWLEPMVALLENDHSIAACQPKLLSYHDRNLFEYAGASGGWIDIFGYPFTRGRVFDHCETDHQQYDAPEACFWASGAALFVRAQLYHQLGGLDEYFFAHQEEIDFCWRLQLSGFKIFVQPASVVYHVGGGTLAKGSPRKTYLNYRNNMIMLYKNLRWYNKLWQLPVRMLLNGVDAVKNLIGGDTQYFAAVVKAHLHFAGWMFFKKKASLFVKRKTGTLYGHYHGSIVWAYFIRGKKTFLEIVRHK
ncbi:MAG: glycosyl transferase family 2 [Ferruginibacter sp.]|nr:glycosyl transferase family 2 [Ferruginibacter sp.]